MIFWKKAWVVLGIVATIPVAFIGGCAIGDRFYMRFVFEGDVKDFAPGDSFGVLFYSLLFAAFILVPAMYVWMRVYRKVIR